MPSAIRFEAVRSNLTSNCRVGGRQGDEHILRTCTVQRYADGAQVGSVRRVCRVARARLQKCAAPDQAKCLCLVLVAMQL